MTTNTAYTITAQVAVEAIVNNPTAFDRPTADVVLADAIALNVPSLYTDMLADILTELREW